MRNLIKTLTLALVLLLGGATANAQFRAGIRAGMTVNKLHLSNMASTVSSDNRCGFTAGVMTEFTIPVIGICFDVSLMYSRMNSQVDAPVEVTPGGTPTNNFEDSGKDFFQIPVNIKYKFGLPIVGKFLTPYIYTGPDFAFRLGHSNAFKHFQAAWDLGVGLELINHVQIGAGYSWGINNVAKKITGSDIFDSNFKTRNNYWTITAAYLF